MKRFLHPAISVLVLAACASGTRDPQPAQPAPMPTTTPIAARREAGDPRPTLRAGWMDAEEAIWNLRVVSRTPPSDAFINRAEPGDFRKINSDISFTGNYAIQGNFSGVQVWDISNPARPRLHRAFVCPGSQSDVSAFRNLLFVSGEALDGRTDCGTEGIQDSVSHHRLRGIRIFDITDIANPRLLTNVQTCRGSHTHTVVSDPDDAANVYIYVSGSAPVRSSSELAGCSAAAPDKDPNSALFRIEVIQVPLAAPATARIVSSPRIFSGLVEAPSHGEAPEDIAAAARRAAEARARGGYTASIEGMEIVLPPGFVTARLDSIVKARGGTGTPTAADSATLRANAQRIVDVLVHGPEQPSAGPRPGPTQCHDITVYPAIGLAGGACGGYGLLLDIRDPANPRRIAAAADSNFSYWHSATFNNDGTKVLFTDEWGGGLAPRCRPTDKKEWGANAIFTLRDSTMTFKSYYKLPVPQSANENCVAHNGTLIPIPGRDVMVQGWYQGGISVFDWTDPSRPFEIAYFDRGPMDSTKLVGAGSWSAYWYNGHIISSEIARGLDIIELAPSAYISQNEIDAAKLVRFAFLNAQDQQKLVWPASFVVARAYADQLQRTNGMATDRLATVRSELAAAERLSGAARRDALTQLAGQLDRDAANARDQAKVRALAASVRELANAAR
jgi:hypothetical protein